MWNNLANEIGEFFELTPHQKHEQMFVKKVISMLETHPEDFNGRWSNGDSLDRSVQYKDGTLLIFYDGSILRPTEPYMLYSQKYKIRKLIKSIFERDSLTILKKYV